MLQVNFIMIYIIHKISELLKITRILKCFLRTFILEKKEFIFFTRYTDEKFKDWKDKNIEENIIKDKINLFI